MDTPEEVTMHEGVTLVSWGLCPSSCVTVYWALDNTSVCRSLPIFFIFLSALLPFTSGARTQHYCCCHLPAQHPTHVATASRCDKPSSVSSYRCCRQSRYCSCISYILLATRTACLTLPSPLLMPCKSYSPLGASPPLFVDFQQLSSRSCF